MVEHLELQIFLPFARDLFFSLGTPPRVSSVTWNDMEHLRGRVLKITGCQESENDRNFLVENHLATVFVPDMILWMSPRKNPLSS